MRRRLACRYYYALQPLLLRPLLTATTTPPLVVEEEREEEEERSERGRGSGQARAGEGGVALMRRKMCLLVGLRMRSGE